MNIKNYDIVVREQEGRLEKGATLLRSQRA